MQAPENSLIPILVTGTLVVVLLLVFLFLFVIFYQRKMIRNQLALRNLQNEKQAELLNAIFETQENERKRLAEDLHDSVGQVLSAIKLNLYRLNKQQFGEGEFHQLLSESRSLVDESIQEIRHIIHNVLPPLLTDFGLSEALKDLCGKVQHSTGIDVSCESTIENSRFKKEIETALFRVVQELFSNSIKYSEATNIVLHLNCSPEELKLTFEDNGVGFNLEKAKKGFGLKNMQSRINFINGRIEINAKPKKGIFVNILVPLKEFD
ncbi:hypothetical protein GS399_16730 [Pedobacter sp. HMF7647]|uniref:histidine kinase n=1 Tax=Hufsiella arboris TaxID=2695275 RepID=A0A7K1YE36_9SPHI|nr:sensor histidine kinase [Hufsiella arboris]MXV52621.1 hypothetical protein [Hufsiella arboris]